MKTDKKDVYYSGWFWHSENKKFYRWKDLPKERAENGKM